MIESDASGEWEGGQAEQYREGWRGEENALTGGANVGAQGEQVGRLACGVWGRMLANKHVITPLFIKSCSKNKLQSALQRRKYKKPPVQMT